MASGRSDRRRPNKLGIALAISLAVHLAVIGLAGSWVEPVRVDRQLFPVEVVEVPIPEPPEPEPPELAEPETPPSRPETPPARPRLAARTPVAAPIKADPIRREPEAQEPAEPPSNEPGPEEPPPVQVLDLDPAKVARSEVLRRQAELDDDERAERQVADRVDGMMRGALPPRTNDRSAYPELVRDAEGNFTWHRNGMTAKIQPDGTVDFEIGSNPLGRASKLCLEPSTEPGACRPAAMVPGPGGITPPLDLTDLALMARGEDPRAAVKRWFLRQTEDLRGEMAERYRKRSLARAPSKVNRNLARIWSDGRLSGPAKRLLLFRLWDECAEPFHEDDERPEAEVGLRTRDHIISFIRQKAPPGSPWAYTPGEIRILNGRRDSRQRFEPY